MNDTIISKSNEKVKYIKNLNEKKFRQKYNAFYLEGIKVVDEVLESNQAINIMFIACSEDILSKVNGGNIILNKVNGLKNKYQVLNLSKEVFNHITDTKTPQGILVVLKAPNLDINSYNFDDTQDNILIIDRVQDSGNMGTIIRTADAFNVNTVICIKGTTDIYSQKVLRSTMGSILRVDVLYVDMQNNDFIKKIKDANFKIISTSLEAKKSVEELDYNDRFAFILGNEASGISKELLDISDLQVKIPMATSVESLNVSVAASIILYEQYKNKK